MNRRQNALKESKLQWSFRQKLLWLMVSALGLLIMPFLAVFQLIILVRESVPRIKGGLLSLTMLLFAAGSFLVESFSNMAKKKTISSKS